MARLGLSYDDVRRVNPKTIYVGTFGFSRRGRYAPEAGVDDAIQAAVALPHAAVMNGSDVPRYAPVNIVDRSVGIYAMGVVCAALYARERTGLGQAIDVPMFETMTQYVFSEHLYGHTFVPSEGEFGYPRIVNAYRRPYKTNNGYVSPVVSTHPHSKSFLALVGKSALFAADPRLKDMTSRTQHVEALYKFVSEELEQRTTTAWREALTPLGIPVFAMNTFDSLLEDPHLADIGFFQEVDHPSEGRIRIMASPTEWSATPPGVRCQAPRLGEHSREVLGEAGYSAAEIDALVAAGVTREA